MSKRLQVIMNDQEYRELQRAAKRESVSAGEWVRRAVRALMRSRSTRSARDKQTAVRDAARNAFPTGDIDQMLREIEKGYAGK